MGSPSVGSGILGPKNTDWEMSLYHGGSILTEAENFEGKKACFECLLKQMLAVKGAPGNVGGALVEAGEEVRLIDSYVLG